MNLPPRDYTEQEQIIARCLDEFGLRYEQQAYYHPYIIDFYIPEIKMAVEADGTGPSPMDIEVKPGSRFGPLAFTGWPASQPAGQPARRPPSQPASQAALY